MFVEKWFKQFFVVVAMMVVVTTLSSIDVSAKTSVKTRPMETVKPILVELNDDYFNPKVVTIPKGKSMTLILKNAGKKEHTFTVKKLGIDAEVQPGTEKTISVTANNPGTYELICRYHFQEGMVGNLVVK